MSEFPQFQSPERDGIKPRRKLDYKQMLLSKRLPDISASVDKLHMIDVKNPKITRIQCRDGGWVEVQNRQATVYGSKGYADELAKEIMSVGHADYITRLDETAVLSKKGNIVKFPKPTQNSEPSPISEAVVESIADKWRSRGFTNITESPDGVWLSIGATRIQDLGNEVRIHGKASDPAIDAMLQKSLDEWGSEIELYGSQEFKDKAWLQAQRLGVSCFDKSGKPFEPSAEIKKQYEADLAKMGTQAQEIEGIRERKKLTTLMREAASGNKESLITIQQRDPYLVVFLTDHLDAEQLKFLSNESDESLEKQLDGMREIGRETVQNQQVSGGSSVNVPQNSVVENDDLEAEDDNKNNHKPKI